MADSRSDLACYPVRTIGHAIPGTLREDADGRIEAVFESTFYVLSGNGLICIGREEFECGPINCAASIPKHIDWRSRGLQRHSRARVSPHKIEISGFCRLLVSGSKIWKPDVLPNAIMPRNVAAGIDVFRSYATIFNDLSGLGGFLVPDYRPEPSDRVGAAAEIPLAQSQQWLVNAFARANADPDESMVWVEKLSGLGPGLTPSGDDYLGGVLLALHALGEHHLCRRLWQSVQQYFETNGNIISQAHMRNAACGMGSAAIHRTIKAILSGEPHAIGTAVDGVANVGHSSGWDTMLGIIATLDAWLSSSSRLQKNEPYRLDPSANL